MISLLIQTGLGFGFFVLGFVVVLSFLYNILF